MLKKTSFAGRGGYLIPDPGHITNLFKNLLMGFYCFYRLFTKRIAENNVYCLKTKRVKNNILKRKPGKPLNLLLLRTPFQSVHGHHI